MKTKDISDKLKGCMIGGTVGDALGFPVEFLNSLAKTELRSTRSETD